MKRVSINKSIFLLLLFCIILFSESGVEITESTNDSSNESFKTSSFSFIKLPSFRSLVNSFIEGDNPAFEAIFRPMEFREPVIMIPIEGRYGLGFYGTKRANIFRFDPNLISYEDTSYTVMQNNSIWGRFGHFIEFDALQTNLSYLFFKKSYIDLQMGLGFRYSSIFNIPTFETSDTSSVYGPPKVPDDWPLSRTFTPVNFEGNILTSIILQWHPKWFLHLKYSYGLDRVRFYRADAINDLPSGSGTSSAYSVGIKFINESESAARYALGLELRYSYLRIDKINDPDDVTPITGFKYPAFGLYFSIGAFYGGNLTVGDEGKKSFLDRDYVSAKRKLVKFLELYPKHARRPRAEKLVNICNVRIPDQLFEEGENFEKALKLDRALEKYVGASRTANDDLKKILNRKIEKIAQKFISNADSLLELGEFEEALRISRKAAVVSENGRIALAVIEGKVTIQHGKDLASRGFYAQALEKFAEALEIVPSLKNDIRRQELLVAAKMLEDVNKAYDEPTVKLALYSLIKSKEILGKSDEKMDLMIKELEKQLTLVQEYRVKQTIDKYATEAREYNLSRYLPRIKLGMLVAEVQDILGIPDNVTQRTDDKEQNYQMWIYNLPDNRKKFLYFENYLLFKIEEE